MTKQKLERLASLKRQIKSLTQETEILAEEVLNEIKSEGGTKVETDFGTFSIVERRTWTYPPVIQAMAKDLEENKKKAQQVGTAEAEVNYSLSYYPPKKANGEDAE